MATDNHSSSSIPRKGNAGDCWLDVLVFWRDAGPDKWFTKSAAFDAQFRSRFMQQHWAVASRQHDAWQDRPDSSLALILLLDQFPRNAFRGSAHMFATDGLARHYARQFLDGGFMDKVDHALRQFAAVPFMHSENLADQTYALELYRSHELDGIEWAVNHHDIIQRFGRFPHRNHLLGRQTTADEKRFLDEGGFAG